MRTILLSEFSYDPAATLGSLYRYEPALSVLRNDGIWEATASINGHDGGYTTERGWYTRPTTTSAESSSIASEWRPGLFVLRILRTTPKGVWVADAYGVNAIWCSNEATKRYAYPTIEQAAINYTKRTDVHIARLEAQLKQAKNNLYAFNNPKIRLYDARAVREIKKEDAPRIHQYLDRMRSTLGSDFRQ